MRDENCPKHGGFCWQTVWDWLEAMRRGDVSDNVDPDAEPGECVLDARDDGRF